MISTWSLLEKSEIWGAVNGGLDGGDYYQGGFGTRSDTDGGSRGIDCPGLE